ncbi:putative WRKY transcription factor 12 [Iris pallida]|uniref:WRKY transcription factor 12 n=1 Tax=Iris pallida TaxID=29817 RepID=A0AAX6EKV5_IRIPA|nr:putative WRKY transcription factor 12 [Iris pallida]
MEFGDWQQQPADQGNLQSLISFLADRRPAPPPAAAADHLPFKNFSAAVDRSNGSTNYHSKPACRNEEDQLGSWNCKVGNHQSRDGCSSSWWKSSTTTTTATTSSEKGKLKVRRKMREPRFCFKTRSDVDVLDDGYKWRKYGQKIVKNSLHPRSYYRCTNNNCRVKKRVERLSEDCRMVITTYEGRHTHTPSDDTNSSDDHEFFSVL